MDVRTDTEVVKGSEGIVLDHKGSETTSLSSDNERRIPTDEELDTLPKVSGPMPWNAFTVGIVEFAERFSYYGTTAVCRFLLSTMQLPGTLLTPW
jgi:POT family proton-dependent oligopeptide transporter